MIRIGCALGTESFMDPLSLPPLGRLRRATLPQRLRRSLRRGNHRSLRARNRSTVVRPPVRSGTLAMLARHPSSLGRKREMTDRLGLMPTGASKK